MFIFLTELNDSEVSIRSRISNKIKGKKGGWGTLSNKYFRIPRNYGKLNSMVQKQKQFHIVNICQTKQNEETD